MRIRAAILLFLAGLSATRAAAQQASGDCYGLDYDGKSPVVAARVAASVERLHFVKNAYDDKACPAASPACDRKAYLRAGDVVLAGRRLPNFTCVSYVNAADKETSGWTRSDALEPLAPPPPMDAAQWLGKWRSRRDTMQGDIDITRGRKGFLNVSGEATYAVTPDNVRTGAMGSARLAPTQSTYAFVDGDEKPFDKAGEGDCAVRMSRIDRYLLVEDNGNCGGMAVSFTGLYSR